MRQIYTCESPLTSWATPSLAATMTTYRTDIPRVRGRRAAASATAVGASASQAEGAASGCIDYAPRVCAEPSHDRLRERALAGDSPMSQVDRISGADAAGVLSRAFIEDPGYVWIEPNRARRERYLSFLYGRLIVPLCKLGETWSVPLGDSDTVRGVAAWWPPGTSPGLFSMLMAGLAALPLHVGVRATWRTLVALVALGRARSAATRGAPHWFLDHLGVDPAAQGHGLGRRLVLGHLASRVAGGREQVFLHTSRDTNVPFYRSLGFEVVGERRIGGACGFALWTMKREAGVRAASGQTSEPGLPARHRSQDR